MRKVMSRRVIFLVYITLLTINRRTGRLPGVADTRFATSYVTCLVWRGQLTGLASKFLSVKGAYQ